MSFDISCLTVGIDKSLCIVSLETWPWDIIYVAKSFWLKSRKRICGKEKSISFWQRTTVVVSATSSEIQLRFFFCMCPLYRVVLEKRGYDRGGTRTGQDPDDRDGRRHRGCCFMPVIRRLSCGLYLSSLLYENAKPSCPLFFSTLIALSLVRRGSGCSMWSFDSSRNSWQYWGELCRSWTR